MYMCVYIYIHTCKQVYSIACVTLISNQVYYKSIHTHLSDLM